MRHPAKRKPPAAGDDKSAGDGSGPDNPGNLGISAGSHAGFIPTMIEHIMAEYHCTRREAWEEFPLPAALVLLPATLERQGKKPGGPSAEMLAFIAAANHVT